MLMCVRMQEPMRAEALGRSSNAVMLVSPVDFLHTTTNSENVTPATVFFYTFKIFAYSVCVQVHMRGLSLNFVNWYVVVWTNQCSKSLHGQR